ncbi:hypothetical protein EDB81DRAFT_905414 [Dactylonectria macrodidyma]|uniref:Uncharacterized protein n=1 Tax=Dactylonectria macrodidyma TaxID=307937 RepID=A0A9P9IRS1_9HYPO|nr:hypothetical protein EDB81DRAFT_905414 [Dactylonectria macrodidyma]
MAFDYEITLTAAPYLSDLGLILLGFFLCRDRGTKLPYLNPKSPFECSDKREVSEFIYASKHMLYEVAKSFMGKPYRVLSDLGDVVTLPPGIGDETRNDKRFSFTQGLLEVRTPGHFLSTCVGYLLMIWSFRISKAVMLNLMPTRRLATHPRDCRML